MSSLFSTINKEQYQELWTKCLELHSFQEQEDSLLRIHDELKDRFLLLSINHEYRSPWAIQQHISVAKVFAQKDITESLIPITNKKVLTFFQDIYKDRKTLLLHFITDERVSSQQLLGNKLHSCQIPIDSFISTFIIPSFYGHFLGNENLDDFIEAVGIVFDSYSHDPIPFLTSFDNSFICNVLRQFFFSPLIRPTIGEQFTVFYNYFTSNYELNTSNPWESDSSHYTRIQTFFNLFLKELADPISVSPPFLRRLFSRICHKYHHLKEKVIMTVVIYCIACNMISYPTAYSVFPLTSNYKEQTAEFIQLIKYYCAKVSDLPIPSSVITKNAPILPEQQIEHAHIHKLVDRLLAPVVNDIVMPEIEPIGISKGAATFLAQFEENYEVLQILEDTKFPPETILSISVNQTMNSDQNTLILNNNKFMKNRPKCTKELEYLISIFSAKTPNSFIQPPPQTKALQLFVEKNLPSSFDIFHENIVKYLNDEISFIIQTHPQINGLKRSIELTEKAIAASSARFANDIVDLLMSSDPTIQTELDKKKTLMMNDSVLFANFITTHLDSFFSKNTWCSSLTRMVARRFHAQIMGFFSLTEFIKEKKQLELIEQKFIFQKAKFLANLDSNGVDESVAKILNCKDILGLAQRPVLLACRFENPLESAKQIVHSLAVVEDLFVFEFGAMPEANQLMPLLANLFISSPMPNPLIFGEWLSHFLQNLMQSRPKWFFDDSMMPIEHYFQFNEWMKDMIQSLDSPK